MNPRTRTTPLRREGSYEHTPRIRSTPPRAMNSDYEDMSPMNFHSRSAVLDGPSPYHERLTGTPQFNADHVNACSPDNDPLNPPSLHIRPRKLFQEVMEPSFDKQPTREERLRALRDYALSSHLTATSSFIGEKLVVTEENLYDIYHLALSYYQQQEYERALGILNKERTLTSSVRCRYLAALCSIAMENGRDALDYLGHKNPFSSKDSTYFESGEGCIKLESMMCYARGKAYLLTKDITSARSCFKEALTIDVKCFDALDCLVKFNMMEEKDEWEFVMTLPYEEQCGVDSDYFRYLYSLKLKKDILNADKMVLDNEKLGKSLDVQLSIAEKYFTENQYEDCLRICKAIKKQDSFFKESIPLYLSCLYELGMKTELYEYAQELVDKMNDEAVAWHAVGLYYLYINHNLDARKFFMKALTINQFFQESWLGYGHSFSAERDYDQAIDAYLACNRLIPGSYLPLMNIAMEYMEQNRPDLAFEYFTKSLQKSHQDPFLHNEFAVYYYQMGEYEKSREHLHKALVLAKKRQSQQSPIWEKIWCNLGHVYRHPPLQNYDRALKCFENALNCNPKNSDARATVGMIYQIQGKTAKAIKEYHEALTNTGSGELINELLETALESNIHINYSTKSDTPYLNDTFDIFQMANSVGEIRDEVEQELMEDEWNQTRPRKDNKISRTSSMKSNEPVLDEDLIIDEGDLRPNTSREWI